MAPHWWLAKQTPNRCTSLPFDLHLLSDLTNQNEANWSHTHIRPSKWDNKLPTVTVSCVGLAISCYNVWMHEWHRGKTDSGSIADQIPTSGYYKHTHRDAAQFIHNISLELSLRAQMYRICLNMEHKGKLHLFKYAKDVQIRFHPFFVSLVWPIEPYRTISASVSHCILTHYSDCTTTNLSKRGVPVQCKLAIYTCWWQCLIAIIVSKSEYSACHMVVTIGCLTLSTKTYIGVNKTNIKYSHRRYVCLLAAVLRKTQ